MDDKQGAEEAVRKLDRSELDGRNITVEKSRRSRPYDPTPGKYMGPAEASTRFGGPARRYGSDRYDRSYDRHDDRDYGSGGEGLPRPADTIPIVARAPPITEDNRPFRASPLY
eukprot:CAMPEP_0196658388 /NCGR_PEP_ID=MMETSP1086-20130531/29554_1 /TAXON_ID=77921 /ORGANISM="Cyanoptyche  gloeocystis , Strain SAG4.97" /LENGTH=112 /DNA_ID=CAMNT_0041991947 /DNA_START=266 /DNA_END=603 /DNA_ORIENTATION=+